MTIISDQAVDVEVFMTFIDGNQWSYKTSLIGNGASQYAVIGRRPQDIVTMEIEYNGMRYAHPIEIAGDNLKVIRIYGGRDHWSQLLRDAAMGSVARGSVPEDNDGPTKSVDQ